MGHSSMDPTFHELRPWNEGRLIGAKRALKQQQVWAIRFWLDQHKRLRDRALFDLAIDSKLRGCDVVKVPLAIWYRAAVSAIEPSSFNKRLGGRCNLS